MAEFYESSSRHLSSRFLELKCLETAGPRIISLQFKGSPNLFAELPNNFVPTPYGNFHYMGGHRLWHAPESMPRSYIPDDTGVTITELPDGLILEGKTETATGMLKRIEIHLDPEQPKMVVVHSLSNEGLWEVNNSLWALTMFRLGGTVIFPIQSAKFDPDGLLPDRHISLWPYSHINDSRLYLEDEFILLKAKPNSPPFKIGTFNPQGWMAYWLDGVLFRKSFEIKSGFTYPDNNCNAETYCDSDFVELETLAPFTKVAPGASAYLTETWELYDSIEQDFIPEKVIDLINKKFD